MDPTRHNMWGLMQVGIVHKMIFPRAQSEEGQILKTIRKILEDPFFGAIEVSCIEDKKKKSELARLLKMSRMAIIYVSGTVSRGLNLHSSNDEERNNSILEVKRLIDDAYFLGAFILNLASGPDPGKNERKGARKLLVDSLCQLCRYAQDKSSHLMLSLETFDREIDKKLLIGPTVEAKEVAEKVRKKWENFGLTIDLSHIPLIGESIEEALTTARDYLVHIHIGNCILKDRNNSRYGDKHPPFGVEGGEIDVPQVTEFLKILKEIGYFSEAKDGKMPVVSFEIKPSEEEIPEIVIANSKRVLLQALARI